LLAAMMSACGGGAAPSATNRPRRNRLRNQPRRPVLRPRPARRRLPQPPRQVDQRHADDRLQANQGSLDGHFAARPELLVTRNIYSALLKYKPIPPSRSAIWPQLEAAPDGLTYTFKLRQDVEWQRLRPLHGKWTEGILRSSPAPETKSPFAGAISMSRRSSRRRLHGEVILNQPYAAFRTC